MLVNKCRSVMFNSFVSNNQLAPSINNKWLFVAKPSC